jgi:phytoene desaturase
VSTVVVIGAGMGGLSAAARLAAQGHRVTVLEQAATVGGKLGVLRRDGFTFDTGPSLLTLPAVYRDLFAKTGAPLESVLDVVPVDPVCHYRFGDGTELDMPNASPTRAARAWDDALGAGAGADWLRFHERAARIWDTTRGPFLESALEGAGTLLRLARRPTDVRTVAPWSTLRGLGRSYLTHEHQRTYLDRYATYTGSDPRRAPAALATVPFVEQAFGAWYVPGGLRRLGEAVAQRAQERGARIRTGADVSRVLLDAGRTAGVELLDGERIPADVVVANADAGHLWTDLVPGPEGRAGRAGLRRASASLSGFVMMLALRGRTPGLRHHTVLFGTDYDREFDEIFGPHPQPCTDPTVYLCTPDDPAIAPAGHEAMFVLVNAPPGAAIDAEPYAEHVLGLMAARGVDVRDRVLWRELRTPADLATATRSPGGAIYGQSSNGARAAFLRPANRSPVPGLFLVGGSAHPGGGLPLVALSAAITARLVGPA